MRVALSILLAFTACLASDAYRRGCLDESKAVPLCKMLTNPETYDGRQVIVHGVYRMVLHGSVLTAPECAGTYVNLREAEGYRADKLALKVIRSAIKKDQFQPVDVVIRGIFRSARQGQCFGQNCLLYEIESRVLLCAQAQSNVPAATERH